MADVQILPIHTMPSQGGGGTGASSSFIEKAQDPTDLIENLKLTWRGWEWETNEDTGRPHLNKKAGEALMNEKGVSALSGVVKGLISRHIMNAAYGTDTMNKRLYIFGRELSKEMRYKYREWGLDLHSSSRVFWQIWFQVDGTFRQAIDTSGDGLGPWRRTAISAYSEQRIIDNNPPKPQGGLLSKLPFGNSRP